jgi:valyl-tRNA synthetase
VLDVVLPSGVQATILPGADTGEAAGRDRARLEKELAQAEAHLAAARARLANAAFTDKAPPAVVAGARTREAELSEQVERLRSRLAG